MLVAQPAGDFRFIEAPAGMPFSGGVVADDDAGLAHAVFARPLPLAEGIHAAARHVETAGRPVQAICGFELRIPAPMTQEAFAAFNEPYVKLLREEGILAFDKIPATRTNVAPSVSGVVREPSVYGFSYTVETGTGGWVLSGATEGRPGTVSEMLAEIVHVLSGRLEEMEADWSQATAINLYGDGVDASALLPALPAVGLHGVRWYPSLPPIESLRLEIDARSASLELVIDPAS